MSEYFLSVILPIYNVENYLERCVDSIVKQNRDDYEVIMVDDGSTDGSGKLADDLASRFEHCKVIHKANGGLSSARNAGLEVAEGKYVFMIDSDDWIEENTFNKVFDYVSGEPDILKFGYTQRPSGEEVTSIIEPGEYNEESLKKNIIPLLLQKSGAVLFSAWSHIYKMSFLKDMNASFVSEREIGSEDYLFNAQVFIMAKSLKVVDDTFYDYDFRGGSLTNRYRKNLFEQYVKMHKLTQEFIDEKGLHKEFDGCVSFSFIDKFINVCLRNECKKTNDHSLYDGWINTHKMITTDYYKMMMNQYPYERGKANRKVILLLTRLKIVFPLLLMIRRQMRNVYKNT